jgi:hypothetical protein
MSQLVPSRIERVVVFENGALITRRAEVPEGHSAVAIDGLPLRLADESLRVRGVGGVGVGVVEDRCTVDVVGAAPVDNAVAILEVKLALNHLRQRRHTLQLLRGADSVSVELPPPEIDTGLQANALIALLGTRAEREAARKDQERALDLEAREIELRLKELEAAGVVDERPPRVLRGIDVGVTGSGHLEIEYFVHAARWVPSYSLELSRGEKGVEATLVLGALLAQATGEDWLDVSLSVSTSRLSRAQSLPTLLSWRMGRAQPARLKGYRPLPTDLPTLFSGFDKFPTAPRGGSTPLPEPQPSKPRPSPRNEGMVPQESAMPPMMPSAPPAPTRMSMGPPPGAPPPPPPMMAPAPSLSAAPMAKRSSARNMMREERARSAPEPSADMEMDEDTDDELAAMRVGMSAGGFGGMPAPSVVDELPPQLRTAGLRMAFADEGSTRGLLLSMNLRERLAWLLDTADINEDTAAERRNEVIRAVSALEDAERRLQGRSLPPGTQRVAGSQARVFSGASRASIVGDGADHRVEVHRERGPAQIVHHAVPREALDVWRICRYAPSGALPAGPVQVYDDGAFVVAGTVRATAGASMTFNLGVDPDVKIEGRTPHVQQSEKGLMNGTSHVEHRVVTEVRSTKSTPVTLTIFDRLPVPSDAAKDVTVGLNGSAPPLSRDNLGPKGEKLEGGVSATVTLMPGQKASLEHTYTLTLPAKLEVVGGNRRE